MKKLTIICKENILFGSIVSSLAELPDSLANSLTSDYKVSVITLHNPQGSIVKNLGLVRRHSKNVYKSVLSKVEYYLIDETNWMQEIVPLLNQIQSDVIHNFAEPEIVKLIDFTPSKKVYTLSRWDFGFNESSSELYDCVTTIRKNDK
jgi:hypothetical protein